MGMLPETPHFAFVNFRLKTMDLSPIPPEHLISFTYTRTSNEGVGNKFSLTVFDKTAIALEYALSTNTAMSGANKNKNSGVANGTDMNTPGGNSNGTLSVNPDGSINIQTDGVTASELSSDSPNTTTVNPGDPEVIGGTGESTTSQGTGSGNGYDCEFSYGYAGGTQSPVFTGQVTEYDTDFTAGGVTLTISGTSSGLAKSMVSPESIAYKKMLISDIVKAEADINGWYYDDNTIEETAPVKESTTYNTTRMSSGTAGGAGGTATANSQMEGQAGGTVTVPDEYGNGGYTVTCYDEIDWDRNSDSGNLYYNYWVPGGMTFDGQGIATYNGYYLVACTSTFGKVGDKIQFTLDDGTVLNCIMADTKNPNDAGCNQYGHGNGQNVIEFEVQGSWYHSRGTNPGYGDWHPEWGGKHVVSGTNYGSIFGSSGYSMAGQELHHYLQMDYAGPSLQDKLLDAIDNTEPVHDFGKWISRVFSKAGFGNFNGEAKDVQKYCNFSKADPMLPGMIITCIPNGFSGSKYGIVGICLADRMVAFDDGMVRKIELEDFVRNFGPNARFQGGIPSWGWYKNIDLTL